MRDGDSAVRYWAALGNLMRGRPAVEAAKDDLTKVLADAAPDAYERYVDRLVVGDVDYVRLGRPDEAADEALPVLRGRDPGRRDRL